MVEIDQRTIIRASEWYLRMSDERERTKSEEPPRPRFRRRTWGTLRVGLSCESAKVTSYDQNELEGPGICHPGHPSASVRSPCISVCARRWTWSSSVRQRAAH